MGFPLQICIIHSLSQYILTGCPQSLGKLKPSQACCCLQNSSVGCLGLVPLHVRSPHAGLADLERNISPLSQSAQLTLPFMHPLVPLVWRRDWPWFFARTMVSHTLCCSELPGTALALPHWDFFQCQGLLFRHKALTSVLGCMGDNQILKVLDFILQSNPCCFWDEVPDAVSFS